VYASGATSRMIDSEMGGQLLKMYDEFKVKSVRVKITCLNANVTGQSGVMIGTCWDRNG